MGSVTSLFARKVVAVASGNLDPGPLLRSVGIDPAMDPEAEVDVSQMIDAVLYYKMLEAIATQLPDATDFPLKVGATMRCDDYGALGLAWKTAPTLRGSLSRAARYGAFLSSVVSYEVRGQGDDVLYIVHRDGPRRLGLRLSTEATLASVVSMMREVATGPMSPMRVYLKHRAPRSTAEHETYFGCPVDFSADMDALLVSAADLDRRNRLGDDALARFTEVNLASELAARPPEPAFEQQILRRITDRLSDGPPKAADLAREVGLSERTLFRRLSDQGLTYQGLLGKARLRLAEGLLAQSDHSIAEIAFLTGFSEQSSFSRAFKRWANQTPAAFRDNAGQRA